MKAIVVGATGAVGKDLVDQLIADQRFEEIDIFVRHKVETSHPKLTTHIIDFAKPETWSAMVSGDVLFSALGTTRAAAQSKAAQWVVDHDYQLSFAKVAAKNGVKQYVLVSSIGASSKSIFFYSKMKGILEEEVAQMNFDHIAILQPPSLIRKNSDRLGERLSVSVLQSLNKIGMLKSLAPMPTEVVAQAMIRSATSGTIGIETIANQAIDTYARTGKM